MTIEDVEAVDYSAYGALITAGTVFAAEPSRSAAFRAFELARSAGLPILFDIDYRPYSWPTPQVAEEVLSRAGALCEVIVGNDEEFGFMAGDIGRGLDKARALAGAGAAIVVYKMGAEGAVTLAGGEEIRTGIYPVTALKPTGAGDSFMAGFVEALSQGYVRCARRCNGVQPALRWWSHKQAALLPCPPKPNLSNFSLRIRARPTLERTTPMHIAPHDNRNEPIVDVDHQLVPLNYFNIVKLKKGEVFEYDVAGYETCVVPATGTVDVDVEGASYRALGKRTIDVWDGEPEGV